MGHSSVVVVLAMVVAVAAAGITGGELDRWRAFGGMVSAIVAMSFLALVAVLNAMVLKGIVGMWRELRRGELDEKQLEFRLLNRGLVNRILGGRAAPSSAPRGMYPLGILFGLGLETASEVTLLTLSASTAQAGGSRVARDDVTASAVRRRHERLRSM
jgi:high-affinity nickel-transport protein